MADGFVGNVGEQLDALNQRYAEDKLKKQKEALASVALRARLERFEAERVALAAVEGAKAIDYAIRQHRVAEFLEIAEPIFHGLYDRAVHIQQVIGIDNRRPKRGRTGQFRQSSHPLITAELDGIVQEITIKSAFEKRWALSTPWPRSVGYSSVLRDSRTGTSSEEKRVDAYHFMDDGEYYSQDGLEESLTDIDTVYTTIERKLYEEASEQHGE